MQFQTTLWSRIQDAALHESAAEDFVQSYRQPLLDYLRRRGEADPEDVVQEVFLRLYEGDLLTKADQTRARFRSYLLGVTHNVLGERRRRAGAQKRGGDRRVVPLDQLQVPAASDDAFDTSWLRHLLDTALSGLKQENPRQYETLHMRLKGNRPYAEIAADLGRTEAQVKADVKRARDRLVRLVKNEIARYASSDEEYRDELKAFQALIGGPQRR
jgi:RNA polymerase sigma-70 factor (ECF subfamily)